LNDREILIHYVFEHCEYEILIAFLGFLQSESISIQQISEDAQLFMQPAARERCCPGINTSIRTSKLEAQFFESLTQEPIYRPSTMMARMLYIIFWIILQLKMTLSSRYLNTKKSRLLSKRKISEAFPHSTMLFEISDQWFAKYS
jgi:hypothetical protein